MLAPDRRMAVAVLANLSTMEKTEIAEDIMAIMLGGEPDSRPITPDWRHTNFIPDRSIWMAHEGDYQITDGPLHSYRSGDRLLGSALGLPVEFVPLGETQFVMLAVGPARREPRRVREAGPHECYRHIAANHLRNHPEPDCQRAHETERAEWNDAVRGKVEHGWRPDGVSAALEQ